MDKGCDNHQPVQHMKEDIQAMQAASSQFI
jgi:hypothetical protein